MYISILSLHLISKNHPSKNYFLSIKTLAIPSIHPTRSDVFS
jgi:hypothetical protein